MESRLDGRRRFSNALAILPGCALHLLLSVPAWFLVQLNGLAVAGCGSERACNIGLVDIALAVVQPSLIAIWVVTTALAVLSPLRWRRNPWPVLGAGVAASIVVTVTALLMIRVGVGLL
ncbi:hypothetical protein J2X55_000415 [Microbacterium sp. 1154]|uniref:hypothetical protein n=1 Tax=Microbacterium sp. 1154 TaxID=2817733 RepID=UPI00285B7EF1|nr:hypothetical protein [Microbacterium sp. 1154]MDR6689516.1 hypothetical protein [Microbacterium sp. 1154]